jgi:hypothetical protein
VNTRHARDHIVTAGLSFSSQLAAGPATLAIAPGVAAESAAYGGDSWRIVSRVDLGMACASIATTT